jgi:predicted DsbA family dithiol-disulfide isomerase
MGSFAAIFSSGSSSDHEKFQAMHRAMFEAFFRDGRDIGNIDVIADIGASVDLAPTLVKRALEAGTYLNRVLAQERRAPELGVTGVPAMFVGDDAATAEPVIGAVPYDWFKAVVERALSGTSTFSAASRSLADRGSRSRSESSA